MPTERNADMLRKVADRIEMNPAAYDQTIWFETSDEAAASPASRLSERQVVLQTKNGGPRRTRPITIQLDSPLTSR